MFNLKDYQKDTLDTLQKYLQTARLHGAEQAFYDCLPEGNRQRYKTHEGLEGVPHVCLRLPTGGGKTILAAHAVKRAASSYMEKDFPVVLWMTPTNIIRTQTLEALKNPRHPYREALENEETGFPGKVAVFDISEFEQIRPQDLTEKTCIIVSTFAALRVDDEKTDARRIYDHNEAFETHFARLPHNLPGLDTIKDGPDAGKVKFSFANLLYLHQPLLLVDEAHNAVSPTTIMTWKRLSPSCIVEFTATPVNNNTLCSVSAATLKKEQMIKLPIVLTEHTKSWQETVHDALLTLGKLQELALKEPDYLRPLILIQAEDKNREVTVDVVRQHLIDHEKIEPERIAVVTASQKELDKIDLFDRTCTIDVVITVEALKEGWDCSFAYVFCSVANVRSMTAVEQFLGRVLRMPNAKRKQQEELNKAYAHVRASFAQAAALLVDRMIEKMGFDENEALTAIQHEPPKQSQEDLPLFAGLPPVQPLVITLDEMPVWPGLEQERDENVVVSSNNDGTWNLTVHGEINDETEQKLLNAVSKKARDEVSKVVRTHRTFRQRQLSPSEKGEQFLLPRLTVWYDGEQELVDADFVLHAGGWNLLDYPAELPEFAITETAATFEVDLYGERLNYSLLDAARQLDLQHVHTDMTELAFARQLDKELRQPDIRQEMLLEFIRRTIHQLIQQRKLELSQLVRAKYPLLAAFRKKLDEYRVKAQQHGYQSLLFSDNAKVEASFSYTFAFGKDSYCPAAYYKGRWKPEKHFYPNVGTFDSDEECQCAQLLESLPQVKWWVRNLSYGNDAFWLPRATGRFYPDFVALLDDGTLFVVEYKGAHLTDMARTQEAKNIGELWESTSNGKCRFIMVVKEDEQGRDMRSQMLAKLER
jgi:type III restriction enzyme